MNIKGLGLKHSPQNFHGRQLADHITSEKCILRMLPGDNTESGNNITMKHNAKNLNFSPAEEAEIEVIFTEMLNKRIIREAINESTEYV